LLIPGTTWGPHVMHATEPHASSRTGCMTSNAALTCGNADLIVLGSRGRGFKSRQPDHGKRAGQRLTADDPRSRMSTNVDHARAAAGESCIIPSLDQRARSRSLIGTRSRPRLGWYIVVVLAAVGGSAGVAHLSPRRTPNRVAPRTLSSVCRVVQEPSTSVHCDPSLGSVVIGALDKQLLCTLI
jgi:hypothetical protein